MTLMTGLNTIILLTALGLFVQTFRMEPASRNRMRLFALAISMWGVSHFLKPVSESLAFGVDVAGTLLFFGVIVRMMIVGELGKRAA